MNLKLVLLIIVEFQRQRCIVICQIQWNMPRAMSLLWREKLVLSIKECGSWLEKIVLHNELFFVKP